MSEQDIVERLEMLASDWTAEGSEIATACFSDDLEKASAKITRFRSLLKEAVAALETAEEALDNYADAEMIDGRAIGNTAAKAYDEVHDTLKKLKRALSPPPAQEGE